MYKRQGSATTCGELVAFNPRQGPGYDDYPINGESVANQYRSYLRRDLMMAILHAAAVVECKAAGWAGNGGPLGLGDMSEVNGAIPGTAMGSPGHPAGTHTDGRDIDLAYFQAGTPDNRLRPVCPDTEGQNQNHCVAHPDRQLADLGHLENLPDRHRDRRDGDRPENRPALVGALRARHDRRPSPERPPRAPALRRERPPAYENRGDRDCLLRLPQGENRLRAGRSYGEVPRRDPPCARVGRIFPGTIGCRN